MSFPFELVSDSEYGTLNAPKEKITINIYTKHQQLSQLIQYADLLKSIEDVIVDVALTDEVWRYTILDYILNNTTLKTLEIRFQLNQHFNYNYTALVKHVQLVANYLSTSKSIKIFILRAQSRFSLDHQAIEILANGINGSNLEFLGLDLYNAEDNNIELFEKISTNNTIQRLLFIDEKSLSGFGSLLDKSLGANLRQLQIVHMGLCDGKQLSIVNILRNSTKLELFELKYFMKDENFFEICDAIAANRSLKTLIIESYTMTRTEDIQRVLSTVKCHPTIESFQICGIWREGLKSIADSLLENNDNNILRSLTINKQKYGGKGADELSVDLEQLNYFAEKLATNSTLKHLFLPGKCYVPNQRIPDPTFLNALKTNTTLVTLDIQAQSIIDAKGIIDLLSINKTLTTLAVKELYLPDLTKFYEAIMQNESLTSLDISRMLYRSDESAVQFITDIIVNNTTLKELKCNEISAKKRNPNAITIEKILPSLKYNHTLTSLDLFAKYKEITESELKIIADVFTTNKTLVKFNSQAVPNREIEPYIRINREYRVDAVILWHNIVRAEEQVLPLEIWRLILQQVPMFSDIINNNK